MIVKKLEVNRFGANYTVRAGGAGPTTPTLVGPKILLCMVNALYIQNYGRTNNSQIELLFKWSDQSCTPSAALDSTDSHLTICVLFNDIALPLFIAI